MKSESIIEITKATIAVMEAVKGIEKNLTVGSGTSSYQGVADRDVKKIIGEEMAKNGLAIFPVGVDDETRVDSWDETNQYGTKRKQSVFTKVKTTYLLTHTSGEFITIQGFGHGVDSQDKSAGKATTYALKYALLYAFMVPTGKIDDADNTHSDEQPVKKLAKLAVGTKQFNDCVTALRGTYTMSDIRGKYDVSPEVEAALNAEVAK